VSVLVTGATGFIGAALVTELVHKKISLIACVRKNSFRVPEKVIQVEVGELLGDTNWSNALDNNIEVIIHLAARAHIINDKALDPLTEFRKINVEATLNLAKQAVKFGVKRFIFVSSIGVNGSYNTRPFSEMDEVNPSEPYAISKLEAEQGLLALVKKTDMELIIIRPPLVYGVSAPGNFSRLLKWGSKGIPLPFGAIDNQRSLVALENLVSFIIHCIDHPKAANEVFLISDGEDVSTTLLLQKVANVFGKNPLLVPVPVNFMRFFAGLLGRVDMADRLFDSLQVDSSKACNLLGWEPIVTMDEQLKKIAAEGIR